MTPLCASECPRVGLVARNMVQERGDADGGAAGKEGVPIALRSKDAFDATASIRTGVDQLGFLSLSS